ncbi:hypothetical protein [Streptomyces sp. NPDC018833]|uniref:hypothetical protein n=1 Tax=Streptomyces sp. NPDC018833 TaxID=3365053 RepID=UPI003792D25A
MSQLMAAVVGAAGALGGVVVAGTYSLAQARRNSLDRELDRLEQRRSADREARRDVYSQMVSTLRHASAAYEAVYQSSPVDLRRNDNELLARAKAFVDEIEQVANLVMLAGPPLLAGEAEDLISHYGDALRAAEDIVNENPEATAGLSRLATPRQETFDACFVAKRPGFISLAREALGGDNESSPARPTRH